MAGLTSGLVMVPTHAFPEGAIAFGQYGNGGWASGSAYNFRTQAEASAAAMNNCNARGYNCAIRSAFRKSCGVLAVQDHGNGWGLQVNTDISAARRAAMGLCVSHGGGSCSIKETLCDNVSEQEILEAERESTRRQNAEYQSYVIDWRACFGGSLGDWDDQILSCSKALGFPRGSYEDRAKLSERRDSLARGRDEARDNRDRATRQAAQEAVEEATRRARAAEDAARRAEQRAKAAEQTASLPPPSRPIQSGGSPTDPGLNAERLLEMAGKFFKKPVSESAAWGIFLFCLYAAIRETVKAKTPPRYKFLVALGLAGIEWGLFALTGTNPGDPKIIDLVAVNIPLVGVAVGFGFFVKHADA